MKDDSRERDSGRKLNIAAVVLAGGRGTRMESDIPKQYMAIDGYPVLYYSLKAFENSSVDTVAVVCGKGEVSYCKREIVDKYHLSKVKFIVEGGEERYHSVFNGLKVVSDSDYVLIHDGARPFITEGIISDNISVVVEKRACVTGVPSKDTVKIADGKMAVASTPPRENVWIVQTPQTFETSLIYNAYEKLLKEGTVHVTDDAMVIEKVYDLPVYFVMGDYKNIKITTPEDLLIAQAFLSQETI